MPGYDPARYGNVVGDNYDDLYPGDPNETAATAETLARLTCERDPHTLLELGIGTAVLRSPSKSSASRLPGSTAPKAWLPNSAPSPKPPTFRW